MKYNDWFCNCNHRISCKSIFDQLSELRVVSFGVSNCGSCHDWSSSVGEFIVLDVGSLTFHILKNVSHSWLNVKPSTSVLWFFLSPGDCGILVCSEVRDESLEWEWTQALKSQNSYVIITILYSLRFEIIVDLAWAENDFSDLWWLDEVWMHVWKYRSESSLPSEIFNVWASCFESKKFLWSNNNQWLSKWHSHMSSQEMEIVSSGWWPANLHIS